MFVAEDSKDGVDEGKGVAARKQVLEKSVHVLFCQLTWKKRIVEMLNVKCWAQLTLNYKNKKIYKYWYFIWYNVTEQVERLFSSSCILILMHVKTF